MLKQKKRFGLEIHLKNLKIMEQSDILVLIVIFLSYITGYIFGRLDNNNKRRYGSR